jgi:hypothetical protein
MEFTVVVVPAVTLIPTYLVATVPSMVYVPVPEEVAYPITLPEMVYPAP